jgi:Fur family ferric uptake transcriptional regulator
MEELTKNLEGKGIRPTAMRLLILKCFIGSKIALSIGELERVFQKAERSTLFRTIKTFEKKGIVHQIDDGSGIAKFALCEDQCICDLDIDLHLHFHCTACNETQCLTNQKIPQFTLPTGFNAMDANLVIKGMCNKCSRESS